MGALKKEFNERLENRQRFLVCIKQLSYKAKAAVEEATNNDQVYAIAITISMKVNALLKELEPFLQKTTPQPKTPRARSAPPKRISFYLEPMHAL